MPTPNFIRYSTTPDGKSIRAGNYSIGVTSGVTYGPTSTTSYWSGISPPTGGYTLYENKSANGPSIRVPINSATLIDYANRLYSGSSITTEAGALVYFNSLNTVICVNKDYEEIVTSGLTALIDAGFTPSYPKSGTTIYDLSGNGANGTLVGSVTWVSSGTTGEKSYFNFSAGSNSNYISSSVSQSYLDCTMVLMPDFSYSTPTGLAGLIATSSPATNSDKSLRISGVNGTGPWNMTARNPGDGNDWANPTATTYYVNGVASNVLVSGWNVFGGYRTNTAGFPSTFPYFIGSGGYSVNRGFQGKIAVVLLYNRQLSAAEQLTNYNALKGRFGLS
jgi:hypothetical protein